MTDKKWARAAFPLCISLSILWHSHLPDTLTLYAEAVLSGIISNMCGYIRTRLTRLLARSLLHAWKRWHLCSRDLLQCDTQFFFIFPVVLRRATRAFGVDLSKMSWRRPKKKPSMDWFSWENLNRKPWFLPSNIGLSCKISHHPSLLKPAKIWDSSYSSLDLLKNSLMLS